MMKINTSILTVSFFLFLLLLCNADSRDIVYNNYRLVTLDIRTDGQLEAVKNMNLDVWYGLFLGNMNDVLMTDYDIWRCSEELGIPIDIRISDIGTLIEREDQEQIIEYGSAGVGDDWFTSYHSFEEMNGLMGMVAGENPSIVTYKEKIGETFEGRFIPALEITGLGAGPKLKVLIVGGLEGREFNSPSTVLYFFVKLAELYGKDPEITSLLDKLSISFIPIANPDGYEYSRTTSRLWRKNRRLHDDGNVGVDLNRNFGDHWESVGDTSTDDYSGSEEFSEAETLAIKNYVSQNGPFVGGVYYSSYGQSVLRPFGWTKAVPERDPLFKSIADEWSARISKVNRFEYSSKAIYEFHSNRGNIVDWLFSQAGIPYCFSVQLRDSGTYGLFVPTSQILPIAKENLEGLKFFLEAIANWQE